MKQLGQWIFETLPEDTFMVSKDEKGVWWCYIFNKKGLDPFVLMFDGSEIADIDYGDSKLMKEVVS